ncbi:hypothetical protein A5658_03530 [Mycobacterium sp. 1245111.1]|uniref:hypothetical protein n=1 Tax=Mycobacterium sp. 1245111.1 TaxID=1834073 RepID=UPI000800A3BD|nr:hypothetical protein [Mycobacterium sp. 1245111.1]OBK38603.1 hypothetical protein A5658_03530 [Mycobacterium sp. 1245111.1]
MEGYVEAIPTAGPPIVLVGYVHGFPRHPEPGAPAEPLMTDYDIRPGAHSPDETYALVSVEWATPHTTIDTDTGHSTTEMRRDGFLGTPTGWTWYLAPAVYDHGARLWRLIGRQLARGHRNAVLPPSVTALGAPEEVPIHDQPL